MRSDRGIDRRKTPQVSRFNAWSAASPAHSGAPALSLRGGRQPLGFSWICALFAAFSLAGADLGWHLGRISDKALAIWVAGTIPLLLPALLAGRGRRRCGVEWLIVGLVALPFVALIALLV